MRAAAIVAFLICLPVAVAGCGTSDPADDNQVAGKQLFVKNCGSCHVLARADTKGTTGPNLDQAFQESLKSGFGRESVRGVVRKQIEFPNAKGTMPANLVEGDDADDIATYVAESVAQRGKDTGLLAEAVKPAGAGKVISAQGGTLTIAADPNGQLAYVSNKASAAAGAVVLSMPNQSGVDHNIALQKGDSGPVLGQSPIVKTGDSKTGSIDVEPGTYTFFCEVPGHREGGMLGTLTVK